MSRSFSRCSLSFVWRVLNMEDDPQFDRVFVGELRLKPPICHIFLASCSQLKNIRERDARPACVLMGDVPETTWAGAL